VNDSADHYHLYDGYNPIAELNASGQVVHTYVWGPNGPICDQVGGQSRFYLFDALGNTRSPLSSTGQVLGQAEYTAWGGMLASSGQTTPLAWQGQSGADIGLDFTGASFDPNFRSAVEAEIGRLRAQNPGVNIHLRRRP
jgi:hypothetical protein